MASRKCRLCERSKDYYGNAPRKCRVCGARCCPECAKKIHNCEKGEVMIPADASGQTCDDEPVLPWRCEDCTMMRPTPRSTQRTRSDREQAFLEVIAAIHRVRAEPHTIAQDRAVLRCMKAVEALRNATPKSRSRR